MDNNAIVVNDVVCCIANTFTELDKIFLSHQERSWNKNSDCKSKIIFPKYTSGKTRISEQELRFVFLHQLENKYFYSVETPTKNKYRFTKKDREDFKEFGLSGEPVPRVKSKKDQEYDDKHSKNPCCESAQFDTVLFDSDGQRIALIEFKGEASNIDDYRKDFLKMNLEGENIPCFFIQLFETEKDKQYILEKLFNSDDADKKNKWDINNTIYVCHSIRKQENSEGKTYFFSKKYDFILPDDKWEKLKK